MEEVCLNTLKKNKDLTNDELKKEIEKLNIDIVKFLEHIIFYGLSETIDDRKNTLLAIHILYNIVKNDKFIDITKINLLYLHNSKDFCYMIAWIGLKIPFIECALSSWYNLHYLREIIRDETDFRYVAFMGLSRTLENLKAQGLV